MKSEIEELKSQLLEKNKTIESLEDNILRLEDILSEKVSKGEISEDQLLKQKIIDLETNNRDLKDKLGFLRFENVQLKRKVDSATKATPSKSFIRVREPKSPSNVEVVKDIIYIENEIKKSEMNREEIKTRLKRLMSTVWKKRG